MLKLIKKTCYAKNPNLPFKTVEGGNLKKPSQSGFILFGIKIGQTIVQDHKIVQVTRSTVP